MSALVLAFAASVLWGLTDFFGGLLSRRMSAMMVVLVSQLSGLAGAIALVLAFGVRAPALDALLPALLAGAGTAVGLAAFYRALAVGTMSLVAPIAATGAVVPVAVGFAIGETPSSAQGAGMAVALAGVVLASRSTQAPGENRGSIAARGTGLALLSAVGIGVGLVGLDAASEAGVLWTVIVTRAVAGALLMAAIAGARLPAGVRAADLPSLVLIGLVDGAAVALLALATTSGLLGIVSVLGSLYPLTTVLLAQVVLGERLRRVQALGVVAALAGVVLIAAG